MAYFATGAALTAALNALPASLTGSYKAFDGFYYAAQYMNNYSGSLSPIEHFVQIGAARGYKPNADFDPAFYQSKYSDLAGLDAADLLFHYVKFGLNEGRAGNATLAAYNWADYLTAYPAVATYVNANLADFAGSTTNGAIAHYVKFGAAQGFTLPTASAPQTFTLTTGIDAITGGAGDDTIIARTVDAVGTAATTLSIYDSIDGGAGDDTLKIYNDGTNNASLPLHTTVSSVETINIYNDGTPFKTTTVTQNGNAYAVVDASKFAGATSINQFNESVAVSNLAATTTVSLATNASDLDTAVSAAATATSATVALNEIGDGVGQNSQSFLAVGGAALNKVTVTGSLATGEADFALEVTVGNDVETLTLDTRVTTELLLDDSTEGSWDYAGTVQGTTAGTKHLTTLDASTSTGDITLDATQVYVANGQSGDYLANISTGSGADTVTIAAVTSATVSASLSSNDGDDALTVSTTGTGATTVNAGAGDDAITVDVGQGTNSGSFDVEAGDGDDTLTVTARDTATLTVTMGAGDDTVGSVTLGADDTIDLGAGDDEITVSGSTTLGGLLNGGDGTDTLVMTSADAAAASVDATTQADFADNISSIEKLSIGQVASGATDTIDLAHLNNISTVISAGTAPAGQTIPAFTVYSHVDGSGGSFEVSLYEAPSLLAGETLTADGVTVAATADLTAEDVVNAFASAYSQSYTAPVGATVSGTPSGTYTAGPNAGYSPGAGRFVMDWFDASMQTGDIADVDLTFAGTAAPAGTLTISNLASGGTFELTALADGDVTIGVKDASTGTADSVNLKLTSTNGFTNTGVITIADVEAVNVVTDDSDTTAATAAFVAPLDIAATETLTVSGDAGLDLTGSTLTALTSLNAAGLTATGAAGGVTVTLVNTGGASVITSAGNDAIILAAAAVGKSNSVFAGAGDDAVTGGTGNDNIYGEGGDDVILGGGGVDLLDGGAGDDVVTGGAGSDLIFGGEGDDSLDGSGGTDSISGGAGADVITGGAGADTLTGGTGRDAFVIGASDSGVTATTIDKISDFGVLSVAIASTDTFASAAAFQALTKGGAGADVLDIATSTLVTASAITQFGTTPMTALAAVTGTDLLVTSDVKYAVNTKGLVTLSGVDAAKVDTLAEWVAVAQVLAATANDTLVFNMGGNAYVYREGGANDTLVELTGVTVGAAGGLVVSGAAGAIGDIVIA